MSVNIIKAKVYGDYRVESSAEKPAASGFDKVVEAAVNKEAAACPPCRGCVRADPVPAVADPSVVEDVANVTDSTAVTGSDSGSDAVATSTVNATGNVATPVTTEVSTVSAEVERSAMYRFTMFIRVSGDFGSMQESLIDKFKEATRGFVNALKGEDTYGVDTLDSYLGKAEEASNSGLQSSKTFIDNMMSAADKGLKAITASLNSAAWMSGINLSGSSSSSLTSTSPMDIARLQLQDAMEKTSKMTSQTGSSGKVKYGAVHELELIKSPELTKVGSDDLSIADNTADAEDSDVVAVTAADSSASGASAGVAISRRNEILDKFLGLIDSMSSLLGGGSSIVRAGFSFTVGNGVMRNHMEVGKTTDSEKSSGEEAEPVAEPESVTA